MKFWAQLFNKKTSCEHWRRSDFDDFTSFCENIVHQNGIVLITAFLSDHKLQGFQEILNLLSKAEKIELLKAVVDFCLAKTSALATAGTKNEYILKSGQRKILSFM